ncbi:pre-toxin TG domain-containing protein [Streptomyces paradoxus]|uniref:pre-toxin TG domain-containing protein n=1 Tax=Streptomyces paradoxus TaxID=66375 RepID=UPI0036F5041A
MAAYAIHYLHKDNTQHFANLRKELVGFTELKEAVKQGSAAITDPALRAKADKQIRAAYAAAQADVDHRLAQVNETIQTVVALAEVTVAFLQIIFALAALVGDPESQKAAKSIRTGLEGSGKDLGKINAGHSQMSHALGDMNDALGEVNGALDQMNRGIGRANKGMDELNKHVPGIKKGAEKLKELPGIEFDFSHLKDTWGSGTSGLDADEQQRRMGLLLGLPPGIGDGKGIVEAVTGKDLATDEELSGFDRATGALVVLSWLQTGKKALGGDDVRTARKGKCVAGSVSDNSFPAGALVLMGGGASTPIERVARGRRGAGHRSRNRLHPGRAGDRPDHGIGGKAPDHARRGHGRRGGSAQGHDHGDGSSPVLDAGPGSVDRAVGLTAGTGLRTSTGAATVLRARRKHARPGPQCQAERVRL